MREERESPFQGRAVRYLRTALAPYGRGAWIARTITDALHTSAAPVIAIAVAPATAVSGTNSYTNGTAFIRAL